MSIIAAVTKADGESGRWPLEVLSAEMLLRLGSSERRWRLPSCREGEQSSNNAAGNEEAIASTFWGDCCGKRRRRVGRRQVRQRWPAERGSSCCCNNKGCGEGSEQRSRRVSDGCGSYALFLLGNSEPQLPFEKGRKGCDRERRHGCVAAVED
ncbi:hypothetical protein GW17_00037864 [Ensete ventricosum]|nr:hypothetical protein GW17_00037864 [Ensete ventricosum]